MSLSIANVAASDRVFVPCNLLFADQQSQGTSLRSLHLSILVCINPQPYDRFPFVFLFSGQFSGEELHGRRGFLRISGQLLCSDVPCVPQLSRPSSVPPLIYRWSVLYPREAHLQRRWKIQSARLPSSRGGRRLSSTATPSRGSIRGCRIVPTGLAAHA